MKPTCFRSDRNGTCCDCRSAIYPGDDIAFKQVMVRSHRDGAGRVWDKKVWCVRHWVCPTNTRFAAHARAEQLNGLLSLRDDFPPGACPEALEDMILAIQSAG